MRGINPKNIPVLVARDVELVKKEARVLMEISADKLRGAWVNPGGNLGVIAIVGPGEFQGRLYDEAVLCEIGIGVSRPYHQALKPRAKWREGEERHLPRRRSWFSLTENQYLAVAPILFLTFQKLTNEKVKTWKHGFFSDDPFFVKTARRHFSRSQKKILRSVSKKPKVSGVRFAVSLANQHLLRDVLWAEFDNSSTTFRLRRLARFLDLYLSWNNGSRRRLTSVSKKREQRIWESLGPLNSKSPHLVPELLRYLPKHKLAYSYISGMVSGAHETIERKLASLALPNPEERINGISIRITTGFSKRDHIVFEVAPMAD